MSGIFSASVIIVNWNGGQYLDQCLRALQAQTLAPERTIVVDNASTDGSTESIAWEFPEVTVVRNENNLGFAAANNLAIG